MTAVPRLLDEDYVSAPFKAELGEMENEAVRRATVAILQRAHPRFFTAPASSTGKYHPDEFFAGPGGDPSGARPNEVNSPYGGQVLHVKRVAVAMRHMADWIGWCGVERELLLAGALCHDIAKFEDGNIHSVKLHEAFVAPRVADILDHSVIGYFVQKIVQLSSVHSGRWGARLPGTTPSDLMTTSPVLAAMDVEGKMPLLEFFLSMGDYLVSRNNIGKFNPNVVDWRAKGR